MEGCLRKFWRMLLAASSNFPNTSWGFLLRSIDRMATEAGVYDGILLSSNC